MAPPAVAQTTELPGIAVESQKLRAKPASATDTRLSDTVGTPAEGGGSATEPVSESGVTGASTSIITREQIERAPQATLADIIAREAGVQITSLLGGVNGARSTIDLRGFGVAGPSNTLILINGRRVSDWDLPSFDLSTIARDSVERIEITRGNSGAVLYGDGAVGGVINIVTRSGAGQANQGRVETGFGSFGTREGSVSVSGSSGIFSAFVNGNVIESDGYRDNSDLLQRSTVGDFRWVFAKGSVYLNLAADDQKLGLPGERMVVPGGVNELRDDRRGTSTPLDYADTQGTRGTLGFTYMLARDIELIVDGGIRAKSQQAGYFSPYEEAYLDTDLTTRSLTPRLNLTRPFLGLPSRVTAGIDLYDVSYEAHRSMFEGLAPIHVYDGGQETFAGYWQQTVSVLPSTDVSFGGRLQRNRTTARDTYDPLAPQSFQDLQGIPLDDSETNHAWHLGLEHQIVPGVTLLARAAESFRVPNIDERIGSALYGSPTDFNLRTQQSQDWEVGLRLRFGQLQVQSSYYDMRLTDELHFDPVSFINTNLDPTRRQGVETIASWQVMPSLRLNGNLTYTDAVFRGGPNAGNEVPMVSAWTGNLGLSWDIIDKALTLDTVVRYVGDRRMDNDQANFQPLVPAHTTVDVRLGGQVDNLFWSAAVANIFDVEYFDYAVASTSTLGRYNAYPLQGRTFMIKAGVTW